MALYSQMVPLLLGMMLSEDPINRPSDEELQEYLYDLDPSSHDCCIAPREPFEPITTSSVVENIHIHEPQTPSQLTIKETPPQLTIKEQLQMQVLNWHGLDFSR